MKRARGSACRIRHQGRDRKGIDCWGLLAVVLRESNALPAGFDRTDYPRKTAYPEIKQYIRRYCTSLPDFVPGCLVELAIGKGQTHVAIYTDTDTLIHVSQNPNQFVVIEHGFRGMWRTRFAPTAWALPGVRYA